MHNLTQNEFVEYLGAVYIAKSVKGYLYKNLKLTGHCIEGDRESGKHFKLSVDELCQAYKDGVRTTTEMRKYISGWKYSPALAILNMIDQLETQVKELDKVEG